MIKIISLNKIYKTKAEEVHALKNVNYDLPQTGLVAITGKSGCGKTTLINIIGGLDSPTTGEIIYNNSKITNINDKDFLNFRRNQIGIINQEFNLIEELTALENIKIKMQLTNTLDIEKIFSYLEDYGIKDLAFKPVNTLSGGEKARIAIIRAIINRPAIILADEPTGNLDAKNSKYVWKNFKKISEKCLVIVATHDNANANAYADECIQIKDGEITQSRIINPPKKINKSVGVNSQVSNLQKKDYQKIFSIPRKMKISVFILISILLSIIGILTSYKLINIPKMHADLLINNNANYIKLYKDDNTNMYANAFNKNDIDTLKSTFDIKSGYNYYESNLIIDDDFFCFSFKNTEEITDYYKYYAKSEFSNNLFSTQTLSFPGMYLQDSVPNGINISNFFADYILKMGIKGTNLEDVSNYSYKDLLGTKIEFDNYYFTIAGVYKVDEELKYKDFISKDDEALILEYLYKFYVDKDFFTNGYFPQNKYYFGSISLNYDNKDYLFYETSELKENEIGISSEFTNNLLKKFELKDEKELIGKEIFINFKDIYNLYNLEFNSKQFKIVELSGINIINSNILKEATLPNKYIRNIMINNLSIDDLKRVLEFNNDKIKISTAYSEDISKIELVYNNIAKTLSILQYIFIIVSITIIYLVFSLIVRKHLKNINNLLILGDDFNRIKKAITTINTKLLFSIIICSFILYGTAITTINTIISIGFNYRISLIAINYESLLFILVISVISFVLTNSIEYIKLKKYNY